jgi:uncharacterized membrane protein HdeD (DUF308 family)
MRQIILGVIGVIWGAAILIAHFAGVGPSGGSGAYGAGQNAAVVFGAVFLLAGAFAVRNALRERRASV